MEEGIVTELEIKERERASARSKRIINKTTERNFHSFTTEAHVALLKSSLIGFLVKGVLYSSNFKPEFPVYRGTENVSNAV